MNLKDFLVLFLVIISVSRLEIEALDLDPSQCDSIVISAKDTSITPKVRNRREQHSRSFEECGRIKRKFFNGHKLKAFFKDLVGGTVLERKEAIENEFPWMAALVMEKNGQMFYCGGSLINHWTILTSASCVASMTPNDLGQLRILLGSHNIYAKNETGRVEARVSQVAYHRRFDSLTMKNNIAVVHLQKRIIYTNQVQPICLSNGTGIEFNEKSMATTAGWGQLLFNPLKSLHKLDVRLWDNKRCITKYSNKVGYFPEIRDDSLCAGSPVPQNKNLCQGNNGSPLTIERKSRFELIGLTSWGLGADMFPCVFTRVDKFRDWIQRSLAMF